MVEGPSRIYNTPGSQLNPITKLLEAIMKRMLLFLSVAVLTFSIQLAAQDSYAPRCSPCVKKRLPQTIGSLAYALESRVPGLQATAAQTVRDLKANFPEESFSSLIIPLMRIVKDDEADHGARILAALALHDLKSAKGDYAIMRTVVFSEDRQLRMLCGAMVGQRIEQQLASQSRSAFQPPALAETK